MNLKEISPEVFFATDKIVTVEKKDLNFLDNQAENSPRRRARICTHRNADDKLHEMTVTLKKDCYLIPEKHIVKVESYHIIEGMADVVIFDADNINDLATYDDPIQYPVGIEHVLVNGELVVHNNKVTGLTPGRAIP